MSKQYSRFNYRRNLVVMLIFLQLITVISILLLSRINTERVLIENAYNTMAKTIAQSVEHTRSFVKPAYQTNDTLRILASGDVINFNDIETIEKLLFTELTNNRDFAGIYIAGQAGDFIYMLRDNSTKEPQQNTFQTKSIRINQSKKQVMFRWRSNDFLTVKQEEIAEYDFDPRSRLWYRQAIEQKASTWTEPYTFFTSKKRGITVSAPVMDQTGHPIGVVGIDIEIDKLSSFLQSISEQSNEYIRITDQHGHLIADSETHLTLSSHELPDLSSGEQETTLSKDFGTFEQNQQEFLYVKKALKQNIHEPNWTVFSTAKTSPFLKEIRDIEKRNIFIAAMTFLLSVFISVIIATKTSKPVENWMNQASTDSLTKLYNRHYFFNTGNHLYSQHAKTQNHQLALMMIDIDAFKRVNDSYGHNVGDDVLKGVAKHIRSLVNEDNTLLARFGGEEFIILFKTPLYREAIQLAETIRKEVANLTLKTTAGDIQVTVSIGISFAEPGHKMSFLAFIDSADKALYHSKGQGRNQVSLTKNSQIYSNA